MRTLALKPTGDGGAALARRHTGLFGLLGVSWTDPAAQVEDTIQARARSAETGEWSDWITLDPLPAGLDGRRPGAHGATEPVWVGASDGVEVRVSGGVLPAGLEVDLVEPGTPGTPGTPGSAGKKGGVNAGPAAFATTTPHPGPVSTAPRPEVVSRAEWNADESLDNEAPAYLPGSRVKAVFVHHTADAAPYDCSQSAAIVRGIHTYHVKTNGWRDLGYNFLVDKCGTIFEGRRGGIDQPVYGAHTYGWNSESTGIAVLGDYTSTGASEAALESVARIAAYKLGQYGGDLNATVTLVAGADQKNGFGTPFVAGRPYPFKAVSGHRDGFNTACPGHSLYAQLDLIRSSGPAARLA
ncbi:peptidoglycan recognition protein [Streptomyces sp. NPDC059431]